MAGVCCSRLRWPRRRVRSSGPRRIVFDRSCWGGNASVTAQIIVVEVYGTLIVAFAVAFGPVQREPLALFFTSAGDMGLACITWLGVIGAAVAIYALLTPVAGGLADATRQILTVGTDAKRLQGQPALAWFIAIGKHMSVWRAVTVSAALFTAMHAYPILMPYTFVFGLFTGWIRMRTHSTLNTLLMHVLNNLLFLSLGLSLLR